MTPAIELRGISKRFGKLHANQDVSLKVAPGSVHAIVGENGAGKSTCMKILYGMLRPNSGEIYVSGKKKIWSSSADAIAAGIGMVHQHFMLAEPFPAWQNAILGIENVFSAPKFFPTALRVINRKCVFRKLESISLDCEMPVPWEKTIGELPVGIQQRIEILKLILKNASIFILDEPTAVLSPQEVHAFFSQLKKMKAAGKTILIITHKLKEVFEISDGITVMRAGRVVAELETKQTNPEELATLMIGRKLVSPQKSQTRAKPGEIIFEAREIRGGKLNGVNLHLRSGEIVGIAGVEGNGQTEMARIFADPRNEFKKYSGALRYFGKSGEKLSSAQVRGLSVGFIQADRHRDGLALGWSAEENFLLGAQRRPEFRKHGIIQQGNLRKATEGAFEKFDIRPKSLEIPLRGFSGGNQQKLILARELAQEPKLIFASQPTRGVDIGAIELIHGQLIQARDHGAGVLLISSELDEIFALSDRILVLFEGRIVAEFKKGEVDETETGLWMSGGKR